MSLRIWDAIFFKDITEGECLWPEFVAHIPELKALEGMEQPPDYHKYDGKMHTLYAVLYAPDDSIVKMAALFHDIGKPLVKEWSKEKGRIIFHKHADASAEITERTLKRFCVQEPSLTQVVELVRAHEFQYSPEWSDKAVRRLMRKLDIRQLAALRRADLQAQGADAKHENDEKMKVYALLSRASTLTL